jgi:hypothetical protein
MGEMSQQLLLRALGESVDLSPDITTLGAEAMGRLLLQLHRVGVRLSPTAQARKEAEGDDARP